MDRDRIVWLLTAMLMLACGPSSDSNGDQSAGGTHVSSTSLGETQAAGTSATGSVVDSTAGTTTDVAVTSSTDESSTGPWVDPACPDVYVGNLFVDARFDVNDLRFTGRVEGSVFVEEFEGSDLEFLDCLHVVEGSVVVRKNRNLVSLQGLGNLGHIERHFTVSQNPSVA